jgi:hypothetical protein
VFAVFLEGGALEWVDFVADKAGDGHGSSLLSMELLYGGRGRKCFGAERTIGAVSWYYCPMLPRLSCLLTGLLFVLLPLQALAGSPVAAGKAVQPCPANSKLARCARQPALSALLPNAVRPLPKIFRTA